MKTESTAYLALDRMDFVNATSLAMRLHHRFVGMKLHDLYDREGPPIVRILKNLGVRLIWLDMKLHDTVDTVHARAKELRAHGADILSVHASGGIEMMRAAKESGATVYAVTVPTTLSPEQCVQIYGSPPKQVVPKLVGFAEKAQVDGIVCAAPEVPLIAGWYKGEIVTPGVRSAGANRNDQKRVDTPLHALQSGATKLVIGRQVTQARDPLKALDELGRELAGSIAA